MKKRNLVFGVALIMILISTSITAQAITTFQYSGEDTWAADIDGNNILGEFVVESENNTAWGTSKGLIEGHADKIVKYLADGKK